MNERRPMPKSEMLRRSVRCFWLGWLALVPVAGGIAALFALIDFQAVVLGKGEQWNAARPYLLLGAWLAGLGLLITSTAAVLALLVLVNS